MTQIEKYGRYIVENGFVKKEKAGYYVAWLKRFLGLKLSDKLSRSDKLKQFRESLVVDDGLQDWQINQALHAAELYLNMFLEGPSSSTVPEEFSERNDLSVKMRDALRVKHYAYRTEKTYLDWLRRYTLYCGEKGVSLDDSALRSRAYVLLFSRFPRIKTSNTKRRHFSLNLRIPHIMIHYYYGMQRIPLQWKTSERAGAGAPVCYLKQGTEIIYHIVK